MAAPSATTIRRSTLSLPAAPLGPEKPLPPLEPRPPLPHAARRMARRARPLPPSGALPARLLDGYGRRLARAEVPALVLENDRLRVTVLPGLGARIHSLRHKPTGRELLWTNPVLRPAALALNGAGLAGGISWHPGSGGRGALDWAPVHAAVVPGPGGGPMLRLWEWERLRDTPFQVDLWLPDGSDFLHAGIRVRNPHRTPAPAPLSWWTAIAVPEHAGTRVLAPAGAPPGAGQGYPGREQAAGEHPFALPDGARPWIAALNADGTGLAHASTAALRGRALTAWGSGPAGRRWQRWLTGEGNAPGHAVLRAGLTRTAREHLPLGPGEEAAWVEAFGPLEADPSFVHAGDWGRARDHAAARLAAALPPAALEAAHEAWLRCADHDPKEPLHAGSGWGALETAARGGRELPGTPFDPAGLGPEQAPWLALLTTGRFPEAPRDRVPAQPPGPSLVAPAWRERLEIAPGGPLTDYHLGVAQWHAGDLAQARRSWERSLAATRGPWALRCLAVAEAADGHPGHAAAHALDATLLALDTPGTPLPALAALAREAIPALLAAGRPRDAEALHGRLPGSVRASGRMRLLHARVLLAAGDAAAARALLEEGIELPDARPGDTALAETWSRLSEQPLPERYDFGPAPA
ncbi:DUF5107 domain-containing protein [Streptomyces sp. DSM 44917]|uniref:DUF5107 domain-containing protein n=1 Tax=Streptomyces boetiae TaxID=3075541 RepID=A0ABU2L8J7_9ACTN|nr:DUF5107 domain-containing protein [Streptomyces sp. DSM 44917]MDT0307894.1 DUF5107 domain-containing protein [Streptomyces sp. DSM 44917]